MKSPKNQDVKVEIGRMTCNAEALGSDVDAMDMSDREEEVNAGPGDEGDQLDHGLLLSAAGNVGADSDDGDLERVITEVDESCANGWSFRCGTPPTLLFQGKLLYIHCACFSEYPLTNSRGEVMYFPNPVEEVILDRGFVSEQEKSFHWEFFAGSSGSRNSDRYLKIRNHILDSW